MVPSSCCTCPPLTNISVITVVFGNASSGYIIAYGLKEQFDFLENALLEEIDNNLMSLQ